MLAALVVTKIWLAALSREDTPEKDRRDFYLTVDEASNIATESLADMLSEARKYRLSLTLAGQYISQMTETVRDAIFGNSGTLVSFKVGAQDGEFLEREYSPVFNRTHLVNLEQFSLYIKLMIDGVSSQPFSAVTEPLLEGKTGNREKVVAYSRERYGRPVGRNITQE